MYLTPFFFSFPSSFLFPFLLLQTFGLKNKNKSKKVGEYVNQVKKQADHSVQAIHGGGEDAKTKAARKKEEEAARKAELALLYQPVLQAQKVPVGVDPKSILCQYFKAGTCQKGSKCKFSHDPSVERKTEKIDLYNDPRASQEADTMDKWDQQKLEDVVAKKQKGSLPETDIICKYFLDAVENGKYGWFWECPNGPTCHYRHALPPGFVLKRDRRKDDDEDQPSLEDWIEIERKKLSGALTPVTLETFKAWKTERMERKAKEESEKRDKKEAAMKAGKTTGISGRDLFTYRPDLFVDDQEAESADVYANRIYNEEEAVEGEQKGDAMYDVEVDEDLFDLDIEDDDEEEEDNEEDDGGAGSSARP